MRQISSDPPLVSVIIPVYNAADHLSRCLASLATMPTVPATLVACTAYGLGVGNLITLPSLILRPRLVVQQLYFVGQLSMVIIVLAGSFVGMVLALQGYRTLIRFGAEESLGVFVALVIVRELGAVVTALLFAGRAGSALAAELGLMNATDQLQAMEMMAVDPVKRVVAPRFDSASWRPFSPRVARSSGLPSKRFNATQSSFAESTCKSPPTSSKSSVI